MTGWWRSAFISPLHPIRCSPISPTPAATSSGWAAAQRWSRYRAAPTASGCAAASKRPVSSSRSARRTGWYSPGAGRTTPPCRPGPRGSSSRYSRKTAEPASCCATMICPTTSRASTTSAGGTSTSAAWRPGPGARIPARIRTPDHGPPLCLTAGSAGTTGSLPGESSGVGSPGEAFRERGSVPSGARRERLLLPHLAGGAPMTDVGNIQAGAVGTAPVAARPTIQVVPLKGLPIVAVVVAFVIASIAGNWLWALTFCHVVGGGLWTAIDLFVGLIVGPILGRLSLTARAEFTARFMPAMVLLMPTLVLMTLAAGFQLALKLGNLSPASLNHAWLVASFCVVGVMAVIALGVLEPANITVLVEMRKQQPDGAVIAPLMRRFIYTAGITGLMQVATLIIMTRVATQ